MNEYANMKSQSAMGQATQALTIWAQTAEDWRNAKEEVMPYNPPSPAHR